MDHYAALTSYQLSAVVMAAAKAGVFRALAQAPGSSAGQIASETKLSERGAIALLRSLDALGYVAQKDGPAGHYELTQAGELFTQTGASGLARLAVKEAYFYELWASLESAVRSGEALLAPFSERVKTSPDFARTFLFALNDLAEKGSAGFFAAVPFDGVQRLLDFGGGAAGYATLIARRCPAMHITLIDLPEVVPWAREAVAQAGLTSRIDVRPGDVFTPGAQLPEAGFDAVLVSHLLHDFDAAAGRKILENAAGMARPGGRLIINDVFTGAGPLKAPETLFDLMMLVENPGGGAHPLDEVLRWVSAAGWAETVYEPLYFGGVLQARRPG
jgi:ubiquinone/menaquinone biosynthesis C-methylase UbiE